MAAVGVCAGSVSPVLEGHPWDGGLRDLLLLAVFGLTWSARTIFFLH